MSLRATVVVVTVVVILSRVGDENGRRRVGGIPTALRNRNTFWAKCFLLPPSRRRSSYPNVTPVHRILLLNTIRQWYPRDWIRAPSELSVFSPGITQFTTGAPPVINRSDPNSFGNCRKRKDTTECLRDSRLIRSDSYYQVALLLLLRFIRRLYSLSLSLSRTSQLSVSVSLLFSLSWKV